MHGRFVARPCVFFRSGFSDLFIPYHFSINRNMRAIQRIDKLDWHFIATLHSKHIWGGLRIVSGEHVRIVSGEHGEIIGGRCDRKCQFSKEETAFAGTQKLPVEF